MNNTVIFIHGSRRGLYAVELPVCACWKIKREGMRIDLQNLNGGYGSLGADERNKENIARHKFLTIHTRCCALGIKRRHIIWKNVSTANAGQVASPAHEFSQVRQWTAAERL
jgi:hypothetical protein